MPTYEYECQKCHKTFELFQSMKDEALKECPASHCQMQTWGHGKVRRLLGTGAGLIFKGSGFYITDYRSQSYKEGAQQEKGSKEKKDKTTSTESKPASKETKAKPGNSDK